MEGIVGVRRFKEKREKPTNLTVDSILTVGRIIRAVRPLASRKRSGRNPERALNQGDFRRIERRIKVFARFFRNLGTFRFYGRPKKGIAARLAEFGDAFDELVKNAAVKDGRGGRFRVKLNADGEPVFARRLDRFDDVVAGTTRGNEEIRGDVVDRHMVRRRNANVVVAVHAVEKRILLDDEAVSMVGVHRVAVRKSARDIVRDMEEKGAALVDVEELHADADRKNRKTATSDFAHQSAVEFFAFRGHRTGVRVQHVAVVARVEVAAADKNDAVQIVEFFKDNVEIIANGEKIGNAAGFDDARNVIFENITDALNFVSFRLKSHIEADARFSLTRRHPVNTLLAKRP